MLLEKVNDVNSQVKGYNKWTALHFAAQLGNKEMIRLLEDHGIKSSIQDKNGMTARDIAEEYGTQAILDIVDNERASKGMEILARNFKRVVGNILKQLKSSNDGKITSTTTENSWIKCDGFGCKDPTDLRKKRMLEQKKHELENIQNNYKNNDIKIESITRVEFDANQHHKHRHHHDMLEFQDNKGNMRVSSNSGGTLIPWGYNIAKWVDSSISKLKYLNLVQQIKGWFSNDESRIDEGILDISNNLGYEGSEILKLNQDVLCSKLLKIEDQQKLMFIANNESVSNVVNYDLLDKYGNLLLLDLLIRKKNGVKYKYTDIVISNDLDSAYAQNLAYVAYAPKDLSNLSQQSTVNTEIITELNENLKVLQTELEESIECVCDTGRQRQELQQANNQQCNSRYLAHAHLIHSMSALHVDSNIGYCGTTNLNHVIDQYHQIVPNYT